MEYFTKHILICDDDIKRYPPIISNINVLVELGVEVHVFGYCSDGNLLKHFKHVGVFYHETVVDKTQTNPLKKWLTMILHTRAVISFLRTNYFENNTLVWVFGNENSWRLKKVIENYRSIIYLFEFPHLKLTPRYRFIVPFLNIKKLMQKAHKVVCCEYNRARITQAFFDLPALPVVIENKPYLLNDDDNSAELSDYLNPNQIEILKTKKVILYQGGGLIKNQNILDPICEAIIQMDASFVFCIMASDNSVKDSLKSKYTHERILFLPFIPPPIHLEVTRFAYLGVLSYHTFNSSIQNCLNLLYCAPNKIFEYSKFNIPMMANMLPALEQSFTKYSSGLCVNFEAKHIIRVIKKLNEDYEVYSKGSKKHYQSFDLIGVIRNLIAY